MKISHNKRKMGLYASSALATLFVGGIAWYVFCAVVSIVWFIPYSIETWSVWLGKPYILAWWQSVLIFIGFGALFRKGAIYTSALVAFITFIMAACGFAGL